MKIRQKKRRILLEPKPNYEFRISADVSTKFTDTLLHEPRLGLWNEAKAVIDNTPAPEREYRLVKIEKTFTRWTRPRRKKYYRTGVTKLTPLAAFVAGLITERHYQSLLKNKARVVRVKKRLPYEELIPPRQVTKTKVYEKLRRVWRDDHPAFKDRIKRELPLVVATTKPLKPYTNTIISCEYVEPHIFNYEGVQLNDRTTGIEIPDFSPKPPHYEISGRAIRQWVDNLILDVYDQEPTRYDEEADEDVVNPVYQLLIDQFDVQGISDLLDDLAAKGQFVNGVILYNNDYERLQAVVPPEVFSYLVTFYETEVWDQVWEDGVQIKTNCRGIVDAYVLRDLVSRLASKFNTGTYDELIREESIIDGELFPFTEIERRAEYLRQKIHSTPIRGAPAMAIWLAELPETIKSFHDHLIIVMRLAKALKAKNIPQAIKLVEDAFQMRHNRTFLGKKTGGYAGHAFKAADVVNNEALAWRFGFKPFFDDLFEFIEFYKKLDHAQAYEPKKRRHRLGGAKAISVTMQVDDPLYFSTPTTEDKILLGRVKGTAKVSYEVEYGCMMVIENYAIALLKSLGFTNPLQVAWELIPLSFVINWFVDFSAALESFDMGDDSYSVYDEYISITAHMPPTDFTVELDHDFIVDQLGLEYDNQEPATVRCGFVTIDRERRPEIDDVTISRLMAIKPLNDVFSLSKSFTALQLLWQRSK